MPRTYKPTGSKKYKKHDETTIHAALIEYEKTKCSLAEISAKYNISKSVLHRHNTRFMKKQGGQRVLSSAAEEYIIQNLNHCSEWGYPLDTYDLRMLIKYYLDRSRLDIKRFKNNLPGPDFVKSFLVRNKDKISQRISQNIKMSRAILSAEVIETYFEELKKSLEGVPLCNVINYDETNLSDDPDRRKVVIKRSAKYPERIMTHRKGSTSIMIAASANGTLLPCYVVYKGKNLEESWVQHGPNSCRYNCTTSGWFDSKSFEDWVYNVALPHFKKKEGKKILIGDSLSTHLSLDLIRECKEQNVHFIFLPASSTHLTQPLDIAFFKLIQSAWREILFTWKKNDRHKLSTVPKSAIPNLLKKLLDRIQCKATLNILEGFIKSGICPLDKNVILERLPEYNINLLETNFHEESQGITTNVETEESGNSESEQDRIIFIGKNELKAALEDNQELCERYKTVSNTKAVVKLHEKNEIQPKSKITEKIVKKNLYKTVKINLEEKKGKFSSLAKTINTKATLSTAQPKTQSENSVYHQKFNTIRIKPQSSLTEKVKLQYKTAKQIPGNVKRKFKIESAKPTKSKTLVNNSSKFKKYVNNETNKGINAPNKGSDIIMKTGKDDTGKHRYLNNVDFNVFLNNNKFEFKNEPLYFNDNFCVEECIDISSDINVVEKSTIKQENIEEELICEDEIVHIIEETPTARRVVTSDEIFENNEDMIYILFVG